MFKEHLWHGRVLWGMMVYDSLKALDYLAKRTEVDSSRLGTIGISMGSTMAWWLAALDTRLRVCVDICCLTDFQALIETGAIDRHDLYYFVPGLLKHFTAIDINTLICPRAHLSLAGNHDPLTPQHGLDRLSAAMRLVYRSADAADAWKMVREDVGHFETPLMRYEIVSFLHKWMPSPMIPSAADLADLKSPKGLPQARTDTRLSRIISRFSRIRHG
jgi:acetyl esterase/lipase